MNFLFQNKKLLYSVITGIVIILLIFVYILTVSKNEDPVYEVMDASVITKTIIKEKKLSNGVDLYSDPQNGTLSFVPNDKSFILQLPKFITYPDYDRKNKMKLEAYAATQMNISINQLCIISFQVISATKEKLYTDVCLGEE